MSGVSLQLSIADMSAAAPFSGTVTLVASQETDTPGPSPRFVRGLTFVPCAYSYDHTSSKMEERSVDRPAAKDDGPSTFDIVQDQGKGQGAVHHHASSSGIAFPNSRSLPDSDFSSKATWIPHKTRCAWQTSHTHWRAKVSPRHDTSLRQFADLESFFRVGN